jgi:hypothetical protein
MRNSGVVWGSLLIIMGVLFLLSRLGILAVNVWSVLWPVAIILWGLYLLFGAFGRRDDAVKTDSLALQLKGFESAAVAIRYGAGELALGSGAAPDELLSGAFGGGVEHRLSEEGELARVELRSPVDWPSGRNRRWDVALNGDIPLTLDVETGASQATIDLAHTRTSRLDLRTGASSVDLVLPEAAGHTAVTIEGGAGSVTVRVPEGVAARVTGSAAVGHLGVDETRFPRAGSTWQSPDYDTAANRADIRVSFGAGEVTVQ